MKRLIFSLLVTLTTLAVSAQKDVTKFLGIPVDGTKAEMIQKLKAKGFTSTSYDREVLKGVFNGRNVNVHIVTNGSKVWRIMVADAITQDETNIRIRFNKLCQQFSVNQKYIYVDDFTIPDDERISYEILVNKKRYQAVFYQKVTSPEDIAKANPTLTSAQIADLAFNKEVWFMISSDGYDKYTINMYYDNLYNQANGEDL